MISQFCDSDHKSRCSNFSKKYSDKEGRRKRKKFVLGPEKRFVKLETRTPRKIDAV